jgi:dUTP pyrophosphatase
MNKFEKVSFDEFVKSFDGKVESSGSNIVDFIKLRELYNEIKLPSRATQGSAGYDFFAPISFSLHPGESIKIPTGIKCSLNSGRFLMIVPRSSYGFKYRMQLDNTLGIVDSDYYGNESNDGHIFIKITNDSKNDKVLDVNRGDAFAQGIIMNFDTVDQDDVTTLRTGGIGSTSNN